MIPKLFEIGPVTIHSFGFMLALGFLIIAWVAAREFVRKGYTADDAWTITFAAMIGGVLGAKIYFVLDHWSEALADPGGTIFSGSGLTYYGGLIGGALGVIVVGIRRKIPISAISNMCAPLIALGYGVGRLGCFLNGDDYGRPSDLPWAMSFPKGAPPTDVPVHPTQVYEAAASLGIFFLLWSQRRRLEHRSGLILGLYLVLAATERFLVEFVRLNTAVALGLTTAQWISAGLFVLGGFLIVRSMSR